MKSGPSRGPDRKGYFGLYGGRFVPETLMSALAGLERLYAGAKRVVASLWKVDDDATGEMMGRFYREMLEGNRSPAAALREAQVAMWKQGRWRSPYYWAAFVLQGEWR